MKKKERNGDSEEVQQNSVQEEEEYDEALLEQMESGYSVDGEDEDEETAEVMRQCLDDLAIAEALQAEEDDQY